YSSNCIRTPAANVLFIFINNSHKTLDYPMSKGLRKELVLLFLKYYQLHVEGFRQPRSLKVLEQLFESNISSCVNHSPNKRLLASFCILSIIFAVQNLKVCLIQYVLQKFVMSKV